jgi:hypothetical protein
MPLGTETLEWVAEADFACAACDQRAGRIQLSGSAKQGEVLRETFTGVLTAQVLGDRFASVRSAIAAANVRELFALDLEYAPFYCPTCNLNYCAQHWTVWDVFDDDDPTWHDSIRGRCPHHHERMLED